MKRACFYVLLLTLALLAGCGTHTAPAEEPAGQAEGSAAAAQTETPSPEEEEIVRGEELITVSSAEELLEAIRPGVEIVIEPGCYNLSAFVEEAAADGRVFWQAGEEYVQLRECFDGTEIVIRNVDSLIIRGGGEQPGDTELTVDPRYATVFNFEGCTGLTLEGLTMGHTEQGACEGSVLRFSDCRDIELEQMDLYGCGVYGIEALEGTGDLYVRESVIRDCDYGPFSFEDTTGLLEFAGCRLYGSNGAGYFAGGEGCTLRFTRCSFGEKESNVWYFREDIETQDCTWSEITEYPDYSYMEELDAES